MKRLYGKQERGNYELKDMSIQIKIGNVKSNAYCNISENQRGKSDAKNFQRKRMTSLHMVDQN